MTNAQKLKNEIAGLQRELARVELGTNNINNTVGPNRSRRGRRGRGRGSRGGRGAFSNVIAPRVQNPNVRTPPSSRGAPAVNFNQGEFKIRRTEFLKEINGQEIGSIMLSVDKFTWLNTLARSFDRITWNSVSLHFKSCAGTNTTGFISYGVDWDSSTPSSLSRAIVLALTPVMDHPVWQGSTLPLPSNRLMTRREYRIRTGATEDVYDRGIGYLLYSCTAAKSVMVGELWVSYTATLFGTTA